MATQITLREGEANPLDIVLYDTPAAPTPDPIVIYLCNLDPKPSAQIASYPIVLRDVSATDEITLYDTTNPSNSQNYTIYICERSGTSPVLRALAGQVGSYVTVGNNATMVYTPGAGVIAYALDGAAGLYSIIGNAAAMSYHRGGIDRNIIDGNYEFLRRRKRRDEEDLLVIAAALVPIIGKRNLH